MSYAAHFALLLCLLWATRIGDEERWEGDPPTKKTSLPKAIHPQGNGGKVGPRFPTGADPAIDRGVFMAAFRRQAKDELLPCLKNFQPSPASLLLSAILLKDGRLEDIKAIGTTMQPPECAFTAIRAMRFVAAAATLVGPNQSLQWRLDW